jgi:hypothetical protein
VVIHSTATARKSGKAVQREMAQPFEAEHQGKLLPSYAAKSVGANSIFKINCCESSYIYGFYLQFMHKFLIINGQSLSLTS